MRVTVRDACRICNSRRLKAFLEFKDYPLSDNFLSSPGGKDEILLPFQAHWCEECKTAQNLTDLDWSSYYAGYLYNSSTSQFMRNFAHAIVAAARQRLSLQGSANVVEIGSADGEQLKTFQDSGCKVVGYEPSEGLAKLAEGRGVRTIKALFDWNSISAIPSEMQPVDLFLSFYTLDHVPDPVECLRCMRSVINPQHGLVILEVHDLEQIVKRCEACLFCHEHTIYLSATSMKDVLERAGFKLICTDLIPAPQRRGNSLLVVGAPDTSLMAAKLSRPSSLLKALSSWEVYASLAQRIASTNTYLNKYVNDGIESGRRFAGYGASARSISTLSLAHLRFPQLEYICDQNQSLHGLYLPYSRIPVYSPSYIRTARVDELIVFAYGYLSEISIMLSDFVEHGGKMTSLLELFTRAQPDLCMD